MVEAVKQFAKDELEYFFSLSRVKEIVQSGNMGELFQELSSKGLEAMIREYATFEELLPRKEATSSAYETVYKEHLAVLSDLVEGTPKESTNSKRYVSDILKVLEEKQQGGSSAELEPILNQYKDLLSKVLALYNTQDSGNNIINQSPATKALVNRETGEIFLGKNPESGEPALLQLISGYITPYEKELLECISKFKWDGQITERGKIWFTLGQLYRALRHGAGTTSPQKSQKEALLNSLVELERPERKLAFKLNDYLKVWGGFEANSGRLRVISFDELYGKIQGQEDILIILDSTPFVNAVAENLKMYEVVDQEVKAIQQIRYTLTPKEPLHINGKTVKKKSFKSKEEMYQFCIENSLNTDELSFKETYKPFNLTESRIAMRAVILDFVYRYIRSRAVGRPYSNKLPYKDIFSKCNVNTEFRATVNRAKADIAVILDHLTACESLPELKSWREYTNKHSKRADGIEIFLELPDPELESEV